MSRSPRAAVARVFQSRVFVSMTPWLLRNETAYEVINYFLENSL